MPTRRPARYGITRAQWAVLVKLHREEGLQQAKLAKLLDIQPITLTRLIDKLCSNGLVERRADAKDRRANRLYLTPAARPLMRQAPRAARRDQPDGAGASDAGARPTSSSPSSS